MDRLTTKEAAAIIGYSVSTMTRWRKGKKRWCAGLPGPRFFSVNGRIFYTKDAIEDWEKLCRIDRDYVAQ